MHYVDITGQKIGRLTVVERVANKRDKVYYRCRCECGAECVVRKSHLTTGNIVSCGCFRETRLITHGNCMAHDRSPTYYTWIAMKERCNNPKSKEYHHYGGRGIRVCAQWNHDFERFVQDVGERTTAYHTLDRIDPNGDYEPGNVRWVLPTEQQNNKRNTILLTHAGKTLPISEWAKITGIPRETLRGRVKTWGWSDEEALTTPRYAKLNLHRGGQG